MTTDGSSRVIAVILVVFGLFGACRDFGGDLSREGAMGGTSGGQSGTAGTAGTSGGTGGTEGGSGRGGDAAGGPGGSENDGGSGADGGVAGDGSLGGIGGEGPECWLDQTVTPDCFSYPPLNQRPPAITFDVARAVAVTATEGYDDRFRIIATQSGSNTLGTAYTSQPDHSGWFAWYCFDAVPYPERLAATTLDNDAQEVFAITQCGRVYVRRYLIVSDETHGWSPWVSLELPSSGSFITDASVARLDEANDLFVVDRGSVFVARKGVDAYGPYGPWHRVATGAGNLLAAGVHANGEDQRLFTLDESGRLLTSARPTDDPEAPFGNWSDFGSGHRFADLDAPYGVGGKLIVVALDADVDGKVWTREENDAGDFDDWVELDADGGPTEKLVSIAGASFPARQDQPLMLVAVGRNGNVYSVRRANFVWEPWSGVF
jgi:hypothetical protein